MATPFIRLGLAVSPIALLLAGGCGAADSAADSVRATGAAWEEAYNQRNVEGLIALYADDAVSMPPRAPAKIGREAIRAELSALLSEYAPQHESELEDLITHGDLAIERAAYTDTLTPVSGGPAISETGKHVIVYRRRRSGDWEVLWEIWNLNH